jgi:hypothetical protein
LEEAYRKRSSVVRPMPRKTTTYISNKLNFSNMCSPDPGGPKTWIQTYGSGTLISIFSSATKRKKEKKVQTFIVKEYRKRSSVWSCHA